MLKRAELAHKAIGQYRPFISEEVQETLRVLARQLSGLRVIHVNSTADGGGVAEILRSIVPLMNDIRLDVEWYVIDAPVEFFKVTKKLHNYLQGEAGELTEQDRDIYLRVSEVLCEDLGELRADVWMIHDPQPLAGATILPDLAPKIWRCHIDTSQPNLEAMEFLLPFVEKCDAAVYSDETYRLPAPSKLMEYFTAPAIDPLAEKNVLLQKHEVRERLSRLGIDVERRLIAQVARLDKWKDPIGVIEAYRLAKHKFADLQLILLGVIEAQDDPEALEMYQSVKQAAAGDPDIHIFVDGAFISDRDIAAVQAGSDVILQKSLREGFGLSVTEAMWQSRPVVAGDTPGLRLQVRNGENGLLVQDVQECAEAITVLLNDAALSTRLAAAAHRQAREKYLLPRLLCDELNTYLNMTVLRGFAK